MSDTYNINGRKKTLCMEDNSIGHCFLVKRARSSLTQGILHGDNIMTLFFHRKIPISLNFARVKTSSFHCWQRSHVAYVWCSQLETPLLFTQRIRCWKAVFDTLNSFR